ncbi:Dephospho-CoA kinase [Lentibacillus sp. JNUCC-1]|uniref:GrpB family protein n=1 Tax=Lentibacillus sp. JNUCC-1 TaxID=2654513 RepID=UPI0012E95FD5|nr:GrpB family protein [Lentibacillus sp. JNUCC-1]MUV38262.1 Dephospho-CoA kinase [Lentibacillus sp. JNUCC-1]
MKLGLKRNEVRLEDFHPEWQGEFERVKQEIEHYTQIAGERIAHIGSTAIKGMKAKPIIDILIGVNDIEDVNQSLFQGLKKAGFLRLRVERPQEIVCAKFTDSTYESKTHFIHLVDYQGELWKNLIFFKDYLNHYEKVRTEYAQLKADYTHTSNTGIKDYTDHKEAFVKNIFAKREK